MLTNSKWFFGPRFSKIEMNFPIFREFNLKIFLVSPDVWTINNCTKWAWVFFL